MIQWQNSENVTINNINTSAIIEDSSEVLSYFADKYIITKYKISTGDLVEYAGITYIVVSQIDRNYEGRKEDQYNYRARIRQADFTVKIVLGGKVEIIPSIIESTRFDIYDDKIISLSDDKITLTLQDSDITDKIVKQNRLIKFNGAWEVVGIDKTRLGLITLFCDSNHIDVDDDLENEIADTNLIDSEPDEPIDPEEPPIVAYDFETDATLDNGRYKIYQETTKTFTIIKIINGVETDGHFDFTITNVNVATITNTTDNTVSILGIAGKQGILTLIATDVDNENTVEIDIKIVDWF